MQISLISDSQSRRLFSSAVWSRSCALAPIVSNDFILLSTFNFQNIIMKLVLVQYILNGHPCMSGCWLGLVCCLLPRFIDCQLWSGACNQPSPAGYYQSDQTHLPVSRSISALELILELFRVIIRVMLLSAAASLHYLSKLDPGDTHDTCYQFVINFSADWRVWRGREQGRGIRGVCMY